MQQKQMKNLTLVWNQLNPFKKWPFLFIILAIAPTLSLPLASAFTLNNSVEAVFSSSEVKIYVASPTCQHLGVNQQRLLELAQISVERFWNSVPTSRLRFSMGGIIETSNDLYTSTLCQSDYYTGPGKSCQMNNNFINLSGIVLVCNANISDFPVSTKVVASTLPYISQQNLNIQSATIIINDQSNNPFATLSESEIVATLAHEIGHAIGLGHSRLTDSLMYYSVISTREKLGWDDIAGVSYLYPREEKALGVMACGTIKQVDQNFGGDHFGGNNEAKQASLIWSWACALMAFYCSSRLWRKSAIRSNKV